MLRVSARRRGYVSLFTSILPINALTALNVRLAIAGSIFEDSAAVIVPNLHMHDLTVTDVLHVFEDLL